MSSAFPATISVIACSMTFRGTENHSFRVVSIAIAIFDGEIQTFASPNIFVNGIFQTSHGQIVASGLVQQ